VCVIQLCTIFGATFGWTGGAFGRYFWLFALLMGLVGLRSGRGVLAGSSIGLAASLRLFPALFAVGVLAKAGAAMLSGERPSRLQRRFGLSFVGSALLAVGLTALLPQGLGSWRAFGTNLKTHVSTISPNLVGLTFVGVPKPDHDQLTLAEKLELRERRMSTHRLQLWTVFPLALFLVGLVARETDEVAAAALGIPLALAGLNLASYYYVCLIALSLAHARRPLRLAAIFGLELVTYTLWLFEVPDTRLFQCRSLALVGLLTALYFDAARRQLSWLRTRIGPPGSVMETARSQPPIIQEDGSTTRSRGEST
jgi:hypothetical protein